MNRTDFRAKMLTLIVGLHCCSCLPWISVQSPTGTLGTTSFGTLVKGMSLPLKGEHHRCYRPFDRRYGTPELIHLIEEAAARVSARFPDAVLLVGDISKDGGGRISEHSSHRSGRDVDFAFYTMDAKGVDADGYPLVRFDRFGVGVRNRRAVRFDVARNWELVAALLESDKAMVQWIFVSDGLKALLLRHALTVKADLSLLEKAVMVLHQPGDSAPHDDHFHVRIFCPGGTDGAGCTDQRPFWPWNTQVTEPVVDDWTVDRKMELALDGL